MWGARLTGALFRSAQNSALGLREAPHLAHGLGLPFNAGSGSCSPHEVNRPAGGSPPLLKSEGLRLPTGPAKFEESANRRLLV